MPPRRGGYAFLLRLRRPASLQAARGGLGGAAGATFRPSAPTPGLPSSRRSPTTGASSAGPRATSLSSTSSSPTSSIVARRLGAPVPTASSSASTAPSSTSSSGSSCARPAARRRGDADRTRFMARLLQHPETSPRVSKPRPQAAGSNRSVRRRGRLRAHGHLPPSLSAPRRPVGLRRTERRSGAAVQGGGAADGASQGGLRLPWKPGLQPARAATGADGSLRLEL